MELLPLHGVEQTHVSRGIFDCRCLIQRPTNVLPSLEHQPDIIQRRQRQRALAPEINLPRYRLRLHVLPQLNAELAQQRHEEGDILCLGELAPETRARALGEGQERTAHVAVAVCGQGFLVTWGGRAQPAGGVELVGVGPVAWGVVGGGDVEVNAAGGGEEVWVGPGGGGDGDGGGGGDHFRDLLGGGEEAESFVLGAVVRFR